MEALSEKLYVNLNWAGKLSKDLLVLFTDEMQTNTQ